MVNLILKLHDAVRIADKIQTRTIQEDYHEWWIDKDLERGGRSIFESTIPEFSFKGWGKPWKSLARIAVPFTRHLREVKRVAEKLIRIGAVHLDGSNHSSDIFNCV
jgi:hypothetical protein